MKIDASLTITGIIAFVALLSPIVTAIINNRYQIKIRQLEISDKRYDESISQRKELFENYCQSLSKVVIQKNITTEILNEYASSYGKAILYMSPEDEKLAVSINQMIERRQLIQAYKLTNEHLLSIKKEIQMLNKASK